MTNTIEPLIRTARHGRIYPNRVRVFKDPYSYPSWVVYKGSHWVGSAHSRLVANVAVDVLIQNRLIHLGGLNMQEMLISMTTHRVAERGYHEQWEPATYGKHHDGTTADVLHIKHIDGPIAHYTVHQDGRISQNFAMDEISFIADATLDKPRDFLLNEYGCESLRDLRGNGIDHTGKAVAWPHP
ncbi:hypothetical protein [Glutamicibacter ardleyensis]|uniref:Uncharacterized protein n=1 Tax=Glutamicibacter ardleyensis TaxID=225894 RepID=A0ABQ2DHL7_9MICC|nr:hypothetical protein [Glutamicibacter ardleyensis]GGJ55912.1 hypothetical protein GCM10007173_13460 [Glutamicibacter ardleyensis]